MSVEFRWKPNPALEAAKEWLAKNVTGGDIPKIRVDTLKTEEYVKDTKATIRSVVSKLEEDQNMLAAILELSGFSSNDSSVTVANMIADISFYSKDHWHYYEDGDYNLSVIDFTYAYNDSLIPIIGRLLGPPMRMTFHLTFLIDPTISTGFWIYLADLLASCGVPIALGKVAGSVESSTANTPVLVFENSDLFAAARNLFQSTWEFNCKTFWSPTHIYVQESAFDLFVSLLKMESINRLELMGIKVIESEEEANEGHPKVFHPCDNPHFRFFFGWEPKGFESKRSPKGIVVLPFRTVNEGIEMANALPNSYCASLWSERLKFAPETARKLKMTTVWINCHGVLDPHAPFASDSPLVPLNGPHLFERYLSQRTPKISQQEANCKQHTTKSNESRLSKVSFEEAVKTVELPSSLDLSDRISLLRPLKEKLRDLVAGLPVAHWSDSTVRIGQSKLEIVRYNRPDPLFLDAASDVPNSSVLTIIYVMILKGRPVILNDSSLSTSPELEPLLERHFIVNSSFDRSKLNYINTMYLSNTNSGSKDHLYSANLALFSHFSAQCNSAQTVILF